MNLNSQASAIPTVLNRCHNKLSLYSRDYLPYIVWLWSVIIPTCFATFYWRILYYYLNLKFIIVSKNQALHVLCNNNDIVTYAGKQKLILAGIELATVEIQDFESGEEKIKFNNWIPQYYALHGN